MDKENNDIKTVDNNMAFNWNWDEESNQWIEKDNDLKLKPCLYSDFTIRVGGVRKTDKFVGTQKPPF